MKSMGNLLASGVIFIFSLLIGSEIVLASFVIQSQRNVSIELKGYSGLTGTSLFTGSLIGGGKQTVNTPYRGWPCPASF